MRVGVRKSLILCMVKSFMTKPLNWFMMVFPEKM